MYRRVRDLELFLLRLVAGTSLVLLVLGLLLRLMTVSAGEELHRVSVLTYGFHVLASLEDFGNQRAFGVLLGVGFLGLVVVGLILSWTLIASVMLREASSRFQRVRTITGGLGILGSAIACFFPLACWASDNSGESGGVGAFLLLAGVVLAQWIIGNHRWQHLWVDVDPADR